MKTHRWIFGGVRDSARVLIFGDPGLLPPCRLRDLPTGFTLQWIEQLKKVMPGPDQPDDLAELKSFYTAGNDGDASGFDSALKDMISSYHHALNVTHDVTFYETGLLKAYLDKKTKGETLQQHLQLMCDQGKITKELCASKQTAVSEQLLAAVCQIQEKMKGRAQEQDDAQLKSADAILFFHQVVNFEGSKGPDQDAAPNGEGDTRNNVQDQIDLDLATLEEEFDSFLMPDHPSPPTAVPCKVETATNIVPRPNILDEPLFGPVVIDDDSEDDRMKCQETRTQETPTEETPAENPQPHPKPLASAIQTALHRKPTVEFEDRGETEEEREKRLAHNLYMRFYRSVRSESCPPEISKMALQNKRNSTVLSGLFDEYLKSDGIWLTSSLVTRLRRTSAVEALGEEAMVPFKQLKEEHGLQVAKQMRHQKRQLQAKAKPTDPPFCMDHPDMPGDEDWELIRVWRATTFKKKTCEENQQELEASVELDANQTKDMMSQGGFKVLPAPRDATEPLPSNKNDPKPRTKAAVGRSKLKEIENKEGECKTLLSDVETSTLLSTHLRDGYVNELRAHLTKLTEMQKALSDAIDANDDSQISQQVQDASKAISNMTKGAFKTIKPQLVEKPAKQNKGSGAAKSKTTKRKGKCEPQRPGPMVNFLLQEAGRGDMSYTKVRRVAQVMKKEFPGVLVLIFTVVAVDIAEPVQELKATYGIQEMQGGLYGDDAQYDKNQNKLIIVTLNDVLNPASHSMQSAFPLFVLREIAISFNILFHGKCPGTPLHLLTNYNEEVWHNEVLPNLTEDPLASVNSMPLRASLAEIRGDWKFIKAMFNMNVGWQCRFLCFHCHVTNKNYLQFPANLQEDVPLWGGHDEGLPQRLQRAYQEFLSWARARGIQHSQPPFKTNFFRGGAEDYHAMAAKGYNVYHLAEMMNVVESSPRCLDINTATRIRQLVDRSTKSYALLAMDALQKGKLNWPLKPKLHESRRAAVANEAILADSPLRDATGIMDKIGRYLKPASTTLGFVPHTTTQGPNASKLEAPMKAKPGECLDNCNGHGSCANGVCSCGAGWTGEACDIVTCPSNCNSRGSCIGGSCACNFAFYGAACEYPRCKNDCNGHGYCDSGKCVCNAGYHGAACDEFKEPQPVTPAVVSVEPSKEAAERVSSFGEKVRSIAPPSCPEDCNQRGRCELDGTCTCIANYTGLACEHHCPSSCNGQGTCTGGQGGGGHGSEHR
ncbi:TNC [Symbiodinium sp. CCMP2592]|nr:TNC [Symbiodinium sp. CCMP2592]